jgi:acyl carrier protein
MLVDDIKALIIDVLDLEDIAPEDIDASEALFGDGLGLDSIDALELGIALQKRYELKIDIENDDMRKHFFSVDTLAEFVEERRQL